MGVAQAVGGLVVLAVDHQAVMAGDALERREDSRGVHRDPAPFGVQVEQRAGVGGVDMYRVQPARGPAAGLMEVRDLWRRGLLPSYREVPIGTSRCVRQQWG